MGNIHRTRVFGVLAVCMMCMILSTSTTTVTAAAYWGTLKAGDEMRWDSIEKGTYIIKIVEIDGKLITVERNGKVRTFDPEGFDRPEALSPWILPASDLTGSTRTYEFEGSSYRAYYYKTNYGDGGYYEVWRDVDTGIYFEGKETSADGTVTVEDKLTYSTADMASGGGGGGCLGTLLIALVSVTAVVSYSVLWNKKKR